MSQGRLRPAQLLGYAAGDAGNNLTFSMVGLFLLLYYTDVAGIPATAAGTIFLVVRVWDGLADLIAGRLIDRTRSRWGKFRPWLLFGSVPLLALGVACFWVPPLSLDGKLVYAYLSYAAYGTAYSLVNIPYGSLAAAMTQDPAQRSRLATARTMGAAGMTLLLTLVVSPQIKGSTDLQTSLVTTTGLFAVLGLALYLFTFATARETVARPAEPVRFRASLATLARNAPLRILCLSSLLFLLAQFGLLAVGIYYARDVLGDAGFYVALVGAQSAMYFLSPVVVPPLVRAVGRPMAYRAGCVVLAVGAAGLVVAPGSTRVLPVVCFLLIGAGIGTVSTLMWALEADAVDYGHWSTGVRTEGATYAVYSFVRKLGQALGGAAVSYTIGLAGYRVVAAGAAQSEAARWGIRIATGAVPAVAALLALAVMACYPLSADRFAEIVFELREREPTRQP